MWFRSELENEVKYIKLKLEEGICDEALRLQMSKHLFHMIKYLNAFTSEETNGTN